MNGKSVRLERIMDRRTGRAVIVPMDHGISDGPLEGLTDMRRTVDDVANGGATAVVMHRGLVRHSYRGSGRDVGLLLHLSASTNIGPGRNPKVQIATVEEAIRCGADGCSIHVNFGDSGEPRMLAEAGEVARKCDEWQMPLLIMAYPRWPGMGDPYDPRLVAHCARAAAEIGADIVKVSYTGDVDSFREVVRGALAPVVIAGGPKMDTALDVLHMVHDSVEAGGRGVSIGRNVFQNGDVSGIARAISKIVLEDYSVEEAAAYLR